MKICVRVKWLLTVVCAGGVVFSAAPPKLGADQDNYERSIESVVRHKHFYKTGRLEFGPTAGAMPYDSLVNHYMLGGRLHWHLADHYGWEVIDYQYIFPSVTSYSTNLVSSKGLSNLQTVKIKQLVSSNFLLSPIHGKIRFFGSTVLHFDVYTLLGLGLASTDTLRLSSSGTGAAASQSILLSHWDPLLDFGLGFKVLMNDAMGLVFDLRDYMVYSTTYGHKTLKSNFSVFVGLSFFIPTF